MPANGYRQGISPISVVYRFVIDKPYYRQLISRFNAQRPFLRRPPVQYGSICVVVAGLCLVLSRAESLTAVAIAALVAGLATAAMVYLTREGMISRFSRRTDFNADITVTLSTDGVAGSGERVSGKSVWSAYPRAVRYPDGILLMRAGFVRWLPDSAIRAGTAQDATALVGSKSTLRQCR